MDRGTIRVVHHHLAVHFVDRQHAPSNAAPEHDDFR